MRLKSLETLTYELIIINTMIPNSVLNVDKLRLCFLGPKSLAEKLEARHLLRFRHFTMQKIAQSKVGCQFSVSLKAPKSSRGKDIQLGILRVGNFTTTSPFNTPDYYFWFDLLNARLYESEHGIDAQYQLSKIAARLGLTFYKLTYIELALDTPQNYLPRIAAALSDPGYRVFTLGKAPDSQTEEYRGLNWEVWQSATGITNTALRLKNKEKTMELYCYDKAREVGASGKGYILQADQARLAPITPQNPTAERGSEATERETDSSLWRYEIRLHGDALEEFLSKTGLTQSALFPTDKHKPELLAEMYEYFAQRLIRAKKFRGKTLGRNILQFWELPESAFTPIISIGGLNAN